MTIWHVVLKEILHRKTNFVMGFVSIVVATGCLVGAHILLRVHDVRTIEILTAKEELTKERLDTLKDEMRKSMLKLGFNIVILPKDQNLGDWYAQDYASRFMPEEYVEKLAKSRLVTIRHLLPSLQQKLKWPELKRTVILVGTRGETPDLHKVPKMPIVQPVPEGTIVLGYELHRNLSLKPGGKIKLLGKTFTVHKCHDERGSKDDITVWISLREAQELLNKKGLINAILAVECRCAWADLAKVRSDIMRILPDTQVVERFSKALARAEARRQVGREAQAAIESEKRSRANLRDERERLASILVPLVTAACALWVAALALTNVRERSGEIAILRAMGVRSRQVLFIFLSKALLMGGLAGVVGLALGLAVGKYIGISLESVSAGSLGTARLVDPKLAALALILAPLLSVLASWIPAKIAAQQDPAAILQRE